MKRQRKHTHDKGSLPRNVKIKKEGVCDGKYSAIEASEVEAGGIVCKGRGFSGMGCGRTIKFIKTTISCLKKGGGRLHLVYIPRHKAIKQVLPKQKGVSHHDNKK